MTKGADNKNNNNSGSSNIAEDDHNIFPADSLLAKPLTIAQTADRRYVYPLVTVLVPSSHDQKAIPLSTSSIPKPGRKGIDS